MCAIAGFVFKFKNYINDKTICNVLSSMEDRGPDGTSWLSRGSDGKLKWNEKKYLIKDRLTDLGLGCSRLALQDISDKGLQPIKSNNKKIWVVLNGEIFNFIEIKQKLLQKGYFFKTGTDTEVIANSYQEWGKKCFKFFNGQFAIAIYDMIEDRFIIARDRIGIVPLYYKFEKNSFIFFKSVKRD